MRCLPRSRGVPTSFCNLIVMFLANRGTPQYYSPFNQIKAVPHVVLKRTDYGEIHLTLNTTFANSVCNKLQLDIKCRLALVICMVAALKKVFWKEESNDVMTGIASVCVCETSEQM